jgi:GNAT superfamily N-acetyltransferase
MQVRLVQSDAEVDKIADVMLQLRTAFDRERLVAQMQEQRRQGYEIAYVEAGGAVLCVAGFVVALKLAYGKHVYVDDLVTDARRRSNGAGAMMIQWLKAYALAQGCTQLHLDSGVQRFGAHRFYLREGFDITSHHFAITHLAATAVATGS